MSTNSHLSFHLPTCIHGSVSAFLLYWITVLCSCVFINHSTYVVNPALLLTQETCVRNSPFVHWLSPFYWIIPISIQMGCYFFQMKDLQNKTSPDPSMPHNCCLYLFYTRNSLRIVRTYPNGPSRSQTLSRNGSGWDHQWSLYCQIWWPILVQSYMYILPLNTFFGF